MLRLALHHALEPLPPGAPANIPRLALPHPLEPLPRANHGAAVLLPRRDREWTGPELTFQGLLPRHESLAVDHELGDGLAVAHQLAANDVQEAPRHVDLGRAADEHLRLHQRAVIGVAGLTPCARVDAAEGPALRVLHRRAPIGPQDVT